MTQEDKELLLIDLSARLPYGVIIHLVELNEDEELYCLNIPQEGLYTKNLEYNNATTLSPIEDVKPYLRPMSSMTEKEKEEVKPLFSKFTDKFGKRVLVVRQNKMTLYQDWLTKNMFDYRGLIPMGLALVAPEGMYKF